MKANRDNQKEIEHDIVQDLMWQEVIVSVAKCSQCLSMSALTRYVYASWPIS